MKKMLNSILICIPCLYGVEHTKEAINSVINQKDVDLLLIDNGAEQSVKEALLYYEANFENVLVKHNETNVYVNPAWQQGIDFFLSKSNYSHLIIMNSDLILHKSWSEVLRNRWSIDPNEICLPTMISGKDMSQYDNLDARHSNSTRVYEGTPGVFITLNRDQAKIINPLPSYCKVWFGDEFMYTILRRLDFKTVIPENLISFHYWSQNVQKVEGISEIIEEDKRQWAKDGYSDIEKVIEKYKK